MAALEVVIQEPNARAMSRSTGAVPLYRRYAGCVPEEHRYGVRCVYGSAGRRVNLPAAERLVLACCTRYRLPEPTRLADRLVARDKADV